jgi:CDP-glucose 4,6-dehydratase
MPSTGPLVFTWQDRVALVTGIGGFVGSALASALVERGATVVGILRDSSGARLLDALGLADRIEVVHGSINEPGVVQRVLNEYEVDSVFHLAAQAMVGVANRSPMSTFESNIAGTWHVLEAARLSPKVQRTVVASSDKAYGIQSVLPYTEETPLNGLFPYDASKVCTDVLARCYATSFPLAVGVVRCANIYGPGDLNWSRLVPGTIRSALAGEDPLIRSDGTLERDYLYVSDAVDGYLRVAERLPEMTGEAFNLGTARPISARDLVQQILAIVGNPGLQPRILAEARGEIDRQYLSSEKSHELLGWRPRVGLIEGLHHAVDWYRSYLFPERPPVLQEVRA